ncbi:MAG: hypothetical protein OEW75_07610 [Cyclobacteriaceae bacterium]|nr:hypothetical protein [Cyclobacteriaceae bacterium]
MVSVGGLKKVSKNFSLVFDSFIVPASANNEGYAVLLPSIRWQNGSYKAFQFGFAGLAVQGELIPIPIPMIQLFRLLN